MSSYAHRIQRLEILGEPYYRLSWTVDTKRAGSRLRFPQTRSRDTDYKGALAFAKRHGCAMPEEPNAGASCAPR